MAEPQEQAVFSPNQGQDVGEEGFVAAHSHFVCTQDQFRVAMEEVGCKEEQGAEGKSHKAWGMVPSGKIYLFI